MVLFDQKAQMACLVGDRIQVACIAQLLCEQCCTKSYKINSPATKKNLKTIFNVVCLKKSRSFKRSGYILGSKQNSLKNPLPPYITSVQFPFHSAVVSDLSFPQYLHVKNFHPPQACLAASLAQIVYYFLFFCVILCLLP